MIRDMIVFILKPFSFLPALTMMYIIFSFSAQDGVDSGSLSYDVSHKIVEIGNEVLQKYFILAVTVSFPFYVYGLRGFPLMLVAGLICVGFACGDEYHQSFVEGRGPSVRDVGIDSIGVFCGILFVRIVCWTLLAPARMMERHRIRRERRLERERRIERERQRRIESRSRRKRHGRWEEY